MTSHAAIITVMLAPRAHLTRVVVFVRKFRVRLICAFGEGRVTGESGGGCPHRPPSGATYRFYSGVWARLEVFTGGKLHPETAMGPACMWCDSPTR